MGCLAVPYFRMGGPHYHRRWAVSLPRSGWGRVVPARHGRQAKTAARLRAAPAPGGGRALGIRTRLSREGPRAAPGRLGVAWPSLAGN